jgi:hypothetical protein
MLDLTYFSPILLYETIITLSFQHGAIYSEQATDFFTEFNSFSYLTNYLHVSVSLFCSLIKILTYQKPSLSLMSSTLSILYPVVLIETTMKH